MKINELLLLFIPLFSYSQKIIVDTVVDTIYICEGEKGYINITPHGGSPFTYYWSNGETSQDIYNLDTGKYTLIIFDKYGCGLKKSYLLLEDLNDIEFNAEIQNESCPDASDGFIDYNVETKYSYNINVKPKELTNISDKNIEIIITNNIGCSLDTNIIVKSKEIFTFDSVYIKNPICNEINNGYIEVFTNEEVNIIWNNGKSGKKINKLSEGIYTAYINYGNGCKTKKDFILNNKLFHCLNIPNAFSPNNDGINDKWIIKNLNLFYPECKVKIFNRWGELIYESVGYNEPWDGKYKDNKCPIDSYHYIIETKDKNYTGQITILR
ncbi:MAG: gliding motility-associated C-terminal domain-containing protein [archaeon]